MKKLLFFIFLIAGIVMLTSLAPGLAEEHQSKQRPTPGPTRPTPPPIGKHMGADLRQKVAQMKLKEGSNLVHTENGVKVFALVKGGQIAGWKATDGNGKTLAGEIKPADRADGTDRTCVFCFYDAQHRQQCSEVPCPTAPRR